MTEASVLVSIVRNLYPLFEEHKLSLDQIAESARPHLHVNATLNREQLLCALLQHVPRIGVTNAQHLLRCWFGSTLQQQGDKQQQQWEQRTEQQSKILFYFFPPNYDLCNRCYELEKMNEYETGDYSITIAGSTQLKPRVSSFKPIFKPADRGFSYVGHTPENLKREIRCDNCHFTIDQSDSFGGSGGGCGGSGGGCGGSGCGGGGKSSGGCGGGGGGCGGGGGSGCSGGGGVGSGLDGSAYSTFLDASSSLSQTAMSSASSGSFSFCQTRMDAMSSGRSGLIPPSHFQQPPPPLPTPPPACQQQQQFARTKMMTQSSGVFPLPSSSFVDKKHQMDKTKQQFSTTNMKAQSSGIFPSYSPSFLQLQQQRQLQERQQQQRLEKKQQYYSTTNMKAKSSGVFPSPSSFLPLPTPPTPPLSSASSSSSYSSYTFPPPGSMQPFLSTPTRPILFYFKEPNLDLCNRCFSCCNDQPGYIAVHTPAERGAQFAHMGESEFLPLITCDNCQKTMDSLSHKKIDSLSSLLYFYVKRPDPFLGHPIMFNFYMCPACFDKATPQDRIAFQREQIKDQKHEKIENVRCCRCSRKFYQ